MPFSGLPERLAVVQERVARRQAEAGWTHPVRIVAVTKGWGAAAVDAAREAGLTDVGENRVQEGVEKRSAVTARGVSWHLIGHLQTNKAKLAALHFDYIHSIDSVRLAEAVARRASDAQRVVPVLLQVNVAGEAQKGGCGIDEVDALAAAVAAAPSLALRGLMTMAPFTEDEHLQRRTFEGLRTLRDRLARDGFSVTELSMGMSNDFEAAVAEGATMLRLGTVLFGERHA